MPLRIILLLFLTGIQLSCTVQPVKQATPFQLSGRDYLYHKTAWSFTGRLALSDDKESLSASINWRHQLDWDEIELSGAFGQGHTIITINNESTIIDYGDERLQYFGYVDDLVAKHLGIAVPISALRYWILGIVEPNNDYVSFNNGFKQSGWQVKYQQMQFIAEQILPRKMRVEQNNIKLKLIINHWDI